MRLDPAVFWRMSWREFTAAQRGFFDLMNQQFRVSWEQTRTIAFWATKDTTKAVKKAKDLFRFDWDKNEVRYPTQKEIEEALLKFGKYVDENGRRYNA